VTRHRIIIYRKGKGLVLQLFHQQGHEGANIGHNTNRLAGALVAEFSDHRGVDVNADGLDLTGQHVAHGDAVEGFFSDRDKAVELVANIEIDPLSLVPRSKLTYLREIMIIIEHNAYHLGKIVDIRKAHGNWM